MARDSIRVGLPAMRKEFGDFAERLGLQTRQDVLQISEGLMAIEFGGLDQAHAGGGALSGTQPVIDRSRRCRTFGHRQPSAFGKG